MLAEPDGRSSTMCSNSEFVDFRSFVISFLEHGIKSVSVLLSVLYNFLLGYSFVLVCNLVFFVSAELLIRALADSLS